MIPMRWIVLAGLLFLGLFGGVRAAEPASKTEALSFYRPKATWWETMIASREALIEREEAAERMAESQRRADPALKAFESLRMWVSNQQEPSKIKLRIGGAKRFYLGSAGRGEIFLGNPQLIGHDGKASPLLLADSHINGGNGWANTNSGQWGQQPIPEGEQALREAVKARFKEELAAQPYAALVNMAMPSESRVLLAPLPVDKGGWGQIAKGAYAGKDDPAWLQMLKLVENSYTRPEHHDVAGTCGRDEQCVCNSCSVRKHVAARQQNNGGGTESPQQLIADDE